ncbi:uncharacterized protein [Ptychodera flava]|uniref:uncharacterized protein n=1 Tax=Ptychodera flava TaxID=63121 RepID=UPI00396A5F07
MEICQVNVATAVALLQSLGFLINWEKSKLVPKQQIQFLGMIINSLDMTISLPLEKVSRLQLDCQELLLKKSVTVRCLSRVLGRMTAAVEAVTVSPLHYRAIQKDQLAVLARTGSYDALVVLSQETREELTWWVKCLDVWNGRSLLPQKPQVIIQTDSSRKGWGAVYGHNSAQGQWNQDEQSLHINQLEMLAVSRGLESLVSHLRDVCVEVQCDNSSVVTYINCQGGTRSWPLSKLASKLWLWCLRRNILLTAVYLPGKLNREADYLSRTFNDNLEWCLKSTVLQTALQQLRWTPEVDLFAAHLNAQFPRYVSWKPEPQAWWIDTFSIQLGKLVSYAFPPFCLIPRVLHKIRQDKARLILIAPVWTTQPWYPDLLLLLIQDPYCFRNSQIY